MHENHRRALRHIEAQTPSPKLRIMIWILTESLEVLCTQTYEQCSLTLQSFSSPVWATDFSEWMEVSPGQWVMVVSGQSEPSCFPKKQHQKHQEFISFSQLYSEVGVTSFCPLLGGLWERFFSPSVPLPTHLAPSLCKCCKRIKSLSLGCHSAPRWQDERMWVQ